MSFPKSLVPASDSSGAQPEATSSSSSSSYLFIFWILKTFLLLLKKKTRFLIRRHRFIIRYSVSMFWPESVVSQFVVTDSVCVGVCVCVVLGCFHCELNLGRRNPPRTAAEESNMQQEYSCKRTSKVSRVQSNPSLFCLFVPVTSTCRRSEERSRLRCVCRRKRSALTPAGLSGIPGSASRAWHSNHTHTPFQQNIHRSRVRFLQM